MNLILISQDTVKTQKRINDIRKQHNNEQATVVEVMPEKNILTVEQIRIVVERAALTYPEGAYFIIYNFESARDVVQNTFLKTLEEHSSSIHFILISASREAVLPTILSRCEVEVLHSTPQKLDPSVKKTIEDIFAEYQKSPSRPITSYLSLSPSKKKDTIVEFLRNFITYIYEELPSSKQKSALAKLGKQALRAKVLIEESYFDPETALDMVFMARK